MPLQANIHALTGGMPLSYFIYRRCRSHALPASLQGFLWHNFLVQTYHTNQQQRAPWLKKPIASGLYQPWLIEPGSLTARLKRRYADFAVRLQSQGYAKAFLDELSPLHITLHTATLTREVFLYGHDQAVVFAHSILPRKSLRGRWLGLSRLGNKPLGASLFANPQVQRTALSYKKLSPRHQLYRQATQHLSDKPAYLWARRSVFSLNGACMMVTEVFLPQLLV